MAQESLGQFVSVFRRRVEASQLTDETDRNLLDRFIASRDPAAIEAIVRRHGSLVLSAC